MALSIIQRLKRIFKPEWIEIKLPKLFRKEADEDSDEDKEKEEEEE